MQPTFPHSGVEYQSNTTKYLWKALNAGEEINLLVKVPTENISITVSGTIDRTTEETRKGIANTEESRSYTSYLVVGQDIQNY